MPRGAPRLRTKDGKLNQIGSRARERRLAMNLRQDELCAGIALATGNEWSPSWHDISRIEHGTRIVSDLEMLAMARALGCDACWLLLGSQSP